MADLGQSEDQAGVLGGRSSAEGLSPAVAIAVRPDGEYSVDATFRAGGRKPAVLASNAPLRAARPSPRSRSGIGCVATIKVKRRRCTRHEDQCPDGRALLACPPSLKRSRTRRCTGHAPRAAQFPAAAEQTLRCDHERARRRRPCLVRSAGLTAAGEGRRHRRARDLIGPSCAEWPLPARVKKRCSPTTSFDVTSYLVMTRVPRSPADAPPAAMTNSATVIVAITPVALRFIAVPPLLGVPAAHGTPQIVAVNALGRP